MSETITLSSTHDQGVECWRKVIDFEDGSRETWSRYTFPTEFDTELYPSLEEYHAWLIAHGEHENFVFRIRQTAKQVEQQPLISYFIARLLCTNWYEARYGVELTAETLKEEIAKFKAYLDSEKDSLQ